MNKKSEKIVKIVVMLGIIILAMLAYLGIFNPKYEYVLPIIREQRILAVREYFDSDKNELIRQVIADYDSEMSLVFKATALSAQNPIEVEATMVFPDLPDEAWKKLDSRYYLLFPFAVNTEKSAWDQEYYTAVFPIEKSKTSKQYSGHGTIKYPLEGDKPFFVLLTWDELMAHTEGKVAKIPESYLNNSSNEPLLHIEPSSTTTTLQTNSIIIALTIIVIAFGIYELRFSSRRRN